MLFTTFNGVGEFGSVIHGFGATTRTLVKGTDFNCNTTICFGIGPANHQLFKDLQTTLNRYVLFGNLFAPLVVDGFLGDKTVKAVSVATATANIASPGSTREAVAANAPALIERLAAFLVPVAPSVQPGPPPLIATTQLQPQPLQPVPGQPVRPAVQPSLPPAPSQVAPSQITPGQITPGQLPTSPAAAALLPLPSTTAKIPTWVWITAGVTGAVVIGLVGYALRKPSPEALGDDDYADYSRRYRRRA